MPRLIPQFVLEFGERVAPGTQHESWKFESYYGGYTEKGPLLVTDLAHAHKFPSRENAENVLAGDARFNKEGARIMELEIKL